ncbi:MAG: GGDEF domain-containing protein, partial [Pseudomonadota bacterium]
LHDVLGLHVHTLDRLLPMHLWFGPNGRVNRAGPTLTKLNGAADLVGMDIFDLIDVRQTRMLETVASLLALDGQRVSLNLRQRPDLSMRGHVLALPEGSGGLLNIALGVSFVDAVISGDLTLDDFSPCDPVVDLLYLREANLAVAEESRLLTQRLIDSEQAAEARASTDALTGLANRRAFSAALDRIVDRIGGDFSVMQIDLDKFKAINDALGHAIGDQVLIRAARILRDETRAGDIAARLGGDEFALVFAGRKSRNVLDGIASRILRRMRAPMTVEGHICKIGASIGTTQSHRYGAPDPDQMLRDADAALYEAKRQGRGRHVIFDPDLTDDRRRDHAATAER